MKVLALSLLALVTWPLFGETSRYQDIFYEGLHLRSAAVHFPPFMIAENKPRSNQNPTGNVTYSGYGVEILTSLTEHFPITVDYIPVNQSDVEKFGVTQAVINQLVIRKEVDIVPMSLIRTPQRMQVMDFTAPIMIGSSRLMMPYPSEQGRATAIFDPYPISTWVLILASALSVTVGMSLTAYFHRRWFKEKHYSKDVCRVVAHQADYTLTVLVSQGNYLPYCSWPSVRFVAGAWCLMAVVLVYAYQGSLTSFLAIRRLSPVPQSIEELAASGKKYKLAAEINSATTEMFYAAKSGPYKVIGDNLRRYPYLLFRNFNQATDIMLNYGAAYMRGGLEIVNRIDADLKANNGECRFTASRYLSDVTFLSFGLAKGSAYNIPINHMLITYRDTGLMDRWFNMYLPNIDRCLIGGSRAPAQQRHEKVFRNLKPYDVGDLSGAFFLLAVGISLSVFLFLCELMITAPCSSRRISTL